MPKIANTHRQLIQCIMNATSSGVNAAPQRPLNHMSPWARTRSRDGSQIVKIFVKIPDNIPTRPRRKMNRNIRERGKIPRGAARRSERGPHQHHACEDFSRPDLVAEPSAGNFKQTVGQQECRKNQAHLAFVQAEVVLNVTRSL